MIDHYRLQQERLLVFALTLHVLALVLANATWSQSLAPYQKLVEPYVIPTGQKQGFRMYQSPPRTAYRLTLVATARDGRALPAVSGAELDPRRRQFLVETARRAEPDGGLVAALRGLTGHLWPGADVVRVEVGVEQSSVPHPVFAPLRKHLVELGSQP